jgi:hypothetical protein
LEIGGHAANLHSAAIDSTTRKYTWATEYTHSFCHQRQFRMGMKGFSEDTHDMPS